MCYFIVLFPVLFRHVIFRFIEACNVDVLFLILLSVLLRHVIFSVILTKWNQSISICYFGGFFVMLFQCVISVYYFQCNFGVLFRHDMFHFIEAYYIEVLFVMLRPTLFSVLLRHVIFSFILTNWNQSILTCYFQGLFWCVMFYVISVFRTRCENYTSNRYIEKAQWNKISK